MVGDEPVAGLHDLDDVQLVTVRGLPRILPGEQGAIGQETATAPATLRGLV